MMVIHILQRTFEGRGRKALATMTDEAEAVIII